MADVEKGKIDRSIDVYEWSEIGRLQTGFNRMVAGLRERDQLRDLFGRHVGEEVARRAVEQNESPSGDERDVAVLFIDLVGSTQLAVVTRTPRGGAGTQRLLPDRRRGGRRTARVDQQVSGRRGARGVRRPAAHRRPRLGGTGDRPPLASNYARSQSISASACPPVRCSPATSAPRTATSTPLSATPSTRPRDWPTAPRTSTDGCCARARRSHGPSRTSVTTGRPQGQLTVRGRSDATDIYAPSCRHAAQIGRVTPPSQRECTRMRTAMVRADNAAAAGRDDIRAGGHTGPTSGLAPGFAQANLVMLPAGRRAGLPAVLRAQPGSVPAARGDRHRIAAPGGCRGRRRPAHRRPPLPGVPRRSSCIDEPTDISQYWRADLVAFLLGCSFTFEWALAAAGLPAGAPGPGNQRPDVRHRPHGASTRVPSADRSSCRCARSPRRTSPGSRRSPHAFPPCTAPPSTSAIPPRWGSPTSPPRTSATRCRIGVDEVPVFWACGVTPQAVVQQARPSLAIVHSPGHMFITDRRHDHYDCSSRTTEFTMPGGES